MGHTLRLFLVAVVVATQVASGQSAMLYRSTPRGEARPTSLPGVTLVSEDGELKASLERIARRSQLWRQAVAAVERQGRQALVVTPAQVTVADTSAGRGARAFDRTVLAEAAPVPRDGFRVDRVLVVVNLALIERLHHRRGSLPVEMHWDLDRILVHEVYGHALPYLLAGDLSGRCPDPRPGQNAGEACAIQRENEVRAEMGLGRRTDPGLAGLFLARSN